MKIFYAFLVLLIGISSDALYSAQVRSCYIADAAKHLSNKRLLQAIVDRELAASNPHQTPDEKARVFSKKITNIATELLKRGFHTDAYAVPNPDQQTLLAFNYFALWEGETMSKDGIPLTFLVYVWPPEELATTYYSSGGQNSHYASCIHSHPISCAMAVLKGTFIQQNYVAVSTPQQRRGIARLVDEETLHTCEGDVDDLSAPFIHRMIGHDTGSEPCLSLHAYGASSEAAVTRIFNETFSRCVYTLD